MWCANCHADVAAEVSQDNQRIHCAHCQSDLGATDSLRASSKTEEARELLERWANTDSIDPYGPVVQPAPEVSAGQFPTAKEMPLLDVPSVEIPIQSDSTVDSIVQPLQSNRTQPLSRKVEQQPKASTIPQPKLSQPKFRVDNSHAPRSQSRSYVASPPIKQPPSVNETQANNPDGERMYLHQGHQSTISAPHFDSQLMNQKKAEIKTPQTSVMAVFGQWMAYLGVLILTGGAAMVISGYFGGPAHFTSTGWLVSTFGQMLLFLGVVTLVSGGMEQTTNEVKHEIERLSNQIINFEAASQEIAQRDAVEKETATALRQRVQQELEEINRQLEDRRAS